MIFGAISTRRERDRVTDTLGTMKDIVAKIDAMAPAPKPRGPSKKREKEA
jgi:hypothetical protein